MQESAEDIQKKIEARIDELPEAVRNAILSSEFIQHIQEVAQSFGLHVDQTQELADNTMLLMLGFFNEKEYRAELFESLEKDDAKAQKIAEDINIKVIMPIRDLLKGSVKPNTDAAMETAPSASAATQAAAPASSTPQAPAAAPVPAPKVDLHPADMLLTQKTVAVANAPVAPQPTVAPAKPEVKTPEPPKPQNYTADPYREPIK